MNNLQAMGLSQINPTKRVFINLDFEYKNLIELKESSWLKIDDNYLDAILEDNNEYFECKLEANSNYLMIRLNKKIKKYKNKIKKDNIRLRIELEDREIFTNAIVSKLPIEAILETKSRDYAKVNIYFEEKVYIEIIEIF